MRTAKGQNMLEIIQVMSYFPGIIFKEDILLSWEPWNIFYGIEIHKTICDNNISRRKIATILEDRLLILNNLLKTNKHKKEPGTELTLNAAFNRYKI